MSKKRRHGKKPGRKPGDLQAAHRGEFTDEQIEWVAAVEKFKYEQQIKFPAFTDFLHIAKSLGYKK